VVFIDDILIYSKTQRSIYGRHKRGFVGSSSMLNLRNASWLDSVSFLGHVIFGEGVAVDSEKVMAVVEWTRLINVFEIQSFLGLAGYY
jgi:hypothetical protein